MKLLTDDARVELKILLNHIEGMRRHFHTSSQTVLHQIEDLELEVRTYLDQLK